MTRKHNRTLKKTPTIAKKKSKTSVIVKQHKHTVRRYEAYHENFLSCNKIRAFLTKLQTTCPSMIELKIIGQSAKGRPIYMAVISEGDTASNPKSGVMIVAGSNGSHWFTISSALYLIEQLVKGSNLVRIMNYFIIPCSNPDAYTASLENRGEKVILQDLSKSFPFSLGVYDLNPISDDKFLGAIAMWKRGYLYDCPERIAIMRTFLTHQVAIKLFISLEGAGTRITYPFGFTGRKSCDIDELKMVARAGRNGIRDRCFDIGTMYDLEGLSFGSMLDYLMMTQSSVKFVYSIHVNKEQKNLDPCKILSYGQDVVNCVRFMARNVFMIYDKREIKTCDGFFSFILVFG